MACSRATFTLLLLLLLLLLMYSDSYILVLYFSLNVRSVPFCCHFVYTMDEFPTNCTGANKVVG